ncbi:MAG: hypothetical protein JXM73_01880 [Anaerolineae bacterium]|nr:hypothetical protein [Anaerolineae bacterium]
MRVRVHWPALITLLWLSPVAAEVLSGSMPPSEFLPLGLLIVVPWYGFGAILCRELSIRWQSGLVGLFLLGAAFGIFEEGILVKTFFDPHAIDLGLLQQFGWWGGANWPWMLQLTLYHAVFSITLPVLVVASLWPAERGRPWLSTRWLLALFGILCVMALLGWFFLSPAGETPPYRPGLGQFLGAIIAIAVLVLLAWRLKLRPAVSTFTNRWPLFLAGLGWGVWLVGFWVVSPTLSAALTVLWVGAVAAGLLAFGYRRLRAMDLPAVIGGGTLAAGAWLFWTILAPLQELDNANRADDTSGMALVGLIGLVLLASYLIYLFRQWRKLKLLRHEQAGQPLP